MKIPLPCNFGEVANCNGLKLPLCGVSWFKWSAGMEYTYYFSFPDYWHDTRFYTTFETKQPCKFIISDELLFDKRIKEHGYPLKGRGHAFGVKYIERKTYIEFIMTSNYMTHIKVQCNDKGQYVPNGDIIFPPSWDTEEKQEKVILKSYRVSKGNPLIIKPPEPKQMTIFDFLN